MREIPIIDVLQALKYAVGQNQKMGVKKINVVTHCMAYFYKYRFS